jgi:hypothetical protein
MKRKPEVILKDLELIRRGLDKFTLPILAHLHRIDRYTPTGTESSSGPKPKNTISDPTGNAVANTYRPNDPVGRAIKTIDATISALVKDIQILNEQLDYVMNPERRVPVESQIPQCAACLRDVAATKNDRLRSGYCQSCYRKWLGLGKPYRGQFEADIRAEADPE